MKTIEEKAKAYDKALERAKKLYEKGTITESINYIFPELKESEDERIRKAIKKALRVKCCDYKYSHRIISDESVTLEEAIAWLEKQEKFDEENAKVFLLSKGYPISANGDIPTYKEIFEIIKDGIEYQQKQCEKPQGKSAFEAINEEKVDNANKVEPKFKVGDWIVNKSGFAQQVLDFRCGIYTCTYSSFTTDCESNYHLWTIKDAKDGDVLYSPCCKLLWLYKDEKTCYVGNNLNYHSDSIVVNNPICIPTDTRPATKEQRELLFNKMKEAGYEWDAKNKELKPLKEL